MRVSTREKSQMRATTHPLLDERVEPLRLVLLFLVLLNLPGNPAPLREVERRVLRGTVERLLRLLVLPRKFERARDLVYEARELLRGLLCDRLDVALEHQEVLRLDEDVMLDERGVVCGQRNHPAVQSVLGLSGSGDTADDHVAAFKTIVTHSRSLESPLLHVRVLVHCKHPRLLRGTLALALSFLLVLLGLCLPSILTVRVPCKPPSPVDEVLELARPQLRGPDSEHERDGVHEVRLARAIRANDGREVAKGTYDLVPAVGLEVAELDTNERHRENAARMVVAEENGPYRRLTRRVASVASAHVHE